MKKVAQICLLALLQIGLMQNSVLAAVTLQAVGPSSEVNPNETVTVSVKVQGFTDVNTLQLSIQFDPAVLQFVSTGTFGLDGLSTGGFGNPGSGSVPSNKITLSWEPPDAGKRTVADGTTIFSVQFTAIGASGTSSAVSFVSSPTALLVAINDVESTPSVQNGTVIITHNPPTISTIGNQTTNEDTATSAIAVTVGDAETAAANLTLSGSSSNTTLVPNANIAFGGSGASRTVTITPAANQTGTANVTVTVTDLGSKTASTTFSLTVSAINDAPTIATISNQTTNEDTATSAIVATVGDVDSTVADLTLSGSSSNTTLVPNANIAFGGSGANRTVTITPAADQSGSATITVTVSDGSLSANTSFTLTVNAVNDAPTISAIANQTTTIGVAVGPRSFAVNDVETAAGSLAVTSSSSNTALIPNSGIALGGSGADRTVTITPASGQTGTANITLTVTDANNGSASRTFSVTVSQQASNPVTLTVQGGSVTTGEAITIPVKVQGFTDVNTLQLTLQFDATVLQFVSTGSYGLDGLTAGSFGNPGTGSVPAGKLTLSWEPPDAGKRSVANGTTIFNVQFNAIGAGGTSSAVSLVSSPTALLVAVNDVESTPIGENGTVQVLVVNALPTITTIQDQTINEDATSFVALTVGDAETAAADLTLSGSSSNTTLVPNANILISGSGADRAVVVSPAANQSGTVTITVTVRDTGLDGTANNADDKTANKSFTLTVTAVNDVPTISAISNQTMNEDTATSAIAVTVGDVETAAADLTLGGSSSNTTLVPNANISFGGSGASRTVTVTPAANQFGTATITVTVRDTGLDGTANNGDDATPNTSFTVTVNAVNDVPTLSAIANRTTAAGTATPAIAVTVGDVETAAADLTVSGASSNTTLVPNANIVIAGSGVDRTVTVTPVSGQTGTATITLTVRDRGLNGTAADDDDASATGSFTLTVSFGPAISAQPQSQIVNEGANVTFSVTATGTGQLSYQWQKGGANITGATGTSLVLNGVSANDGADYTVAVTDTIGTTMSEVAHLAVMRTPTVAWNNPAAITYGTPLGTAQLNAAATHGGTNVLGSFEYTPAGGTVLDAGANRTLAVVFRPSDPMTYNNASANATITVNKAPLTITAENKSKKRGTDNPLFTATYSGFVNNDTAASLDTPVTFSTTATTSSAVGNYAIIPSGAADANYTITFANGILTVVEGDPPTISSIQDQSINEDGTTGAISFTIADPDTAVENLTLNKSSANTELIPSANIVLGGSGANRTVTITPAANLSGTNTVTVTVTDGSSSASTTFTVRVASVNDVPAISAIANQTTNEDTPTSAITFSVSDLETLHGSLALSGSTSNPNLVPGANVVFGGSGANRTATIMPAANAFGAATITLTVRDLGIDGVANNSDDASASTSFTLTINAVEGTPTISAISNQSINEDTPTSAISFTIGDEETPVTSLTLSKSSSNEALIPEANIVLGGSGADRNVTITPVANSSGTATITLTVRDTGPDLVASNEDDRSASRSFTVSVNAVNDPPTISTIANQTPGGGSFGPVSFTIGDAETSAGNLVVVSSSSDTTLMPVGGIKLEGSGADRTIKGDAAPGRTGTATITLRVSDAGSLSASTSFTVTIATATAKLAPTVTWSAPSEIVYGTALSANQLNAKPNIPGTLAYDPPAGTVLHAGASQTLSVVFTPTDTTTYSAVTRTVSLTVGKASLTIVADDKSRKEGSANPQFTASYTGFVNNDTAANLDTAVALETAATTASAAGNYPITASAAADADYTIVFVAGTLAVSAKDVPAVSWTAPTAITYGTALGASQLNATASVNGTFAYSPPAGTILSAGGGIILRVTFTPADTVNQATVNASVPINVNKAALTITAANKTKTYGAPVPELTATYAGFVGGDTPDSLDGKPTFTTGAEQFSSAGQYPILVSGAQDANYLITQVAGALTVNARALTVTPRNRNRTEGRPNPPLTGTVVGDRPEDQISAVYSTTATEASSPGDYDITATLVDPLNKAGNYSVTLNTGKLTVRREQVFAGIVHDGYVQGAKVFFDANKNGSQDTGEPEATTLTDAQGKFDLVVDVATFDTNGNGTLDPAEGNIVMTGGKDITTGQELKVPLTAPPGSTVVNPLTTLLAATIAKNPSLSLAENQTKVNQALGIPAGTALTTYDPIAAAVANDSAAKAVINAGAKVQDTLIQVASVVATTDTQSQNQATKAIFEVLADRVTAGTSVQLNTSAALTEVIQQSAAKVSSTVTTANTAGAAEIIAQGNQGKDTIAASSASALDVASQIGQAQVVSQSQTATDLQEVKAGTKSITEAQTENTGQALAQAVQAAPVGTVTGEDEQPGTFSFSATSFQTSSSGTSADVTVVRKSGNYRSVSVKLGLKNSGGSVVTEVPASFADREVTKTINLLSTVTGNAQFAGQQTIPLTLALASDAPEEAILSSTNTTATLTVHVSPVITAHPANLTIIAGNNATFSVAATGVPTPSIQWQKAAKGSSSYSNISGATQSTLVISGSQINDGNYRAIVNNAAGTVTSSPATLRVLVPANPVTPPTIVSPPLGQGVGVGQAVQLSVQAIGGGILTYQWFKDDRILLGQNGPTLVLSNVRAEDIGIYHVVVENVSGRVTSPAAVLTVRQPAFIITPPANKAVAPGTEVILEVEAGGRGLISYQWFKNGQAITGATGRVLNLGRVGFSDEGRYSIRVSNADGEVTGIGALVTVVAPALFKTHPTDQAVNEGERVQLRVEAEGSPTLRYSWSKDGVTIAGAEGSTLVVDRVRSQDAGTYRATVSNLYGAATSAGAIVRVISLTAPFIVTQPIDQTATLGASATFSVDAQGSKPLAFQWLKNGSAITGATLASYSIGSVRPTDAGNYSVVVSNAATNISSATAVLKIQLPVRGDLDGDRLAEIILQDDDGFMAVWKVKGADLLASLFLTPSHSGDANWRIATTGELNGDGREDLVFQHEDGSLAVWYLDGLSLVNSSVLNPSHPGDKDWRIAGAGSSRSDGGLDLYFQHADGTLAYWQMKGAQRTSGGLVGPSHPGGGWRLAGIGQFNADENADLLFQHQDGTVAVWLLDANYRLATARVLTPQHPGDARWRVKAVADWDGDGQADILFQHDGDRSLAVWFMTGTSLKEARRTNPQQPGGSWSVVGPK